MLTRGQIPRVDQSRKTNALGILQTLVRRQWVYVVKQVLIYSAF
jgi:hypothetical protein